MIKIQDSLDKKENIYNIDSFNQWINPADITSSFEKNKRMKLANDGLLMKNIYRDKADSLNEFYMELFPNKNSMK